MARLLRPGRRPGHPRPSHRGREMANRWSTHHPGFGRSAAPNCCPAGRRPPPRHSTCGLVGHVIGSPQVAAERTANVAAGSCGWGARRRPAVPDDQVLPSRVPGHLGRVGPQGSRPLEASPARWLRCRRTVRPPRRSSWRRSEQTSATWAPGSCAGGSGGSGTPSYCSGRPRSTQLLERYLPGSDGPVSSTNPTPFGQGSSVSHRCSWRWS